MAAINPVSILPLIQTFAQLATALAPLIPQLRENLGSDDQEKLKAALAEIQAANDALHGEVQDLLRGT